MARKLPVPPSIAYVIDPRFSGGTSAAIASELRAISGMKQIQVHAITSKMFKGDRIAPVLRNALKDLGLNLIWDAPKISADTVIFHNPSFLRFQERLNCVIVTGHLIVVTHENFTRPSGREGFAVAQCLNIIDRSSLALRKSIAPISPYNRETVLHWMANNNGKLAWKVLDQDWFNICEFELHPANPSPKDRRGRHSRPGLEKFPPLEVMDQCFSAQATSNILLGADLFLQGDVQRPHWEMLPFQSINVDQYFDMIDFMVYFTSPTWRESFGRVLAESIAAGKVVLSDPDTASIFKGAIIPCQPEQVNGIIGELVQNPELYQRQVTKSQRILADFSAEAFIKKFHSLLQQHPIGVVT